MTRGKFQNSHLSLLPVFSFLSALSFPLPPSAAEEFCEAEYCRNHVSNVLYIKGKRGGERREKKGRPYNKASSGDESGVQLLCTRVCTQCTAVGWTLGSGCVYCVCRGDRARCTENLFLKLFLSQTHTHTHTHTLSLFLSLSLSLALSPLLFTSHVWKALKH